MEYCVYAVATYDGKKHFIFLRIGGGKERLKEEKERREKKKERREKKKERDNKEWKGKKKGKEKGDTIFCVYAVATHDGKKPSILLKTACGHCSYPSNV
jgi:hypothetical protein